MDKLPVSACIIVKNEEAMLPDCISSIQDFVSEIIIVDTGSDDRTIETAESYGCKVFRHEWRNDFSAARNFSIAQATQPFILIIDADERLTNPAALAHHIANAHEKTGGWLVQVVSEAMRPDGGVDRFSCNMIRLLRNHPDIRFYGSIHEQVIENILSSGFLLENTAISFSHLGYGLAPEQMETKHRRNLEILNSNLSAEPDNPFYLYHRAKSLFALGNLSEAEADIQKALLLADSNHAVRPQALNYGGIIAFRMGDTGLAESRATESLSIIPNQAFASFILGEVYSSRQNFAEAYQCYLDMRSALDTEDLGVRVIGDYHLAPEQIAYKMGKCLVGLKLWNEALKEFETGLKINPSDISCHVGAANVAFHFKKFDLSRDLLERALKIAPDNQEIRGFLSQVEDTVANIRPVEPPDRTAPKDEVLLSLSMIVRNEENYLPGCLASVKGIVDEIVIVDTGSTDTTREIAREHGARVVEFPWNEDFAAARNESLRNCSGQWILYLDADERLTPESAKNLRNYLLASGPEIGGIICTIESNHLQLDGKSELHRGGYPRVFRNLGYPLIRFEGRVHEQITHSILDTGKSFILSDITIEHLGYNQSREVMEAKVKRNYKLLLQHVQEEPLNSYAWYQLGQTLAQMKLVDQAEETIRFSVGLGNLSNSVYASAAATLAQLTGNKKKFEEALHWAELSIEKAPEQVYAYHLKAYALLYLNRLGEAVREFEDVLVKVRSKRGVPLSGFDIEIPEELVHKGLEEARKRLSSGGGIRS